MNELTCHAATRRQQRSLPPAIVEWLFDFGASAKQDGAEVLYFDRSARARLGSVSGWSAAWVTF